MREKTGGKLKLLFVPSRPISRNQFCRSRGRSHNYIYLYRTRRRTAHMARPANARTDTQTGGRTRRSTDADADARTQTQTRTHGCRRRSTDADADARTQKHGRRRRFTDADASARWRTDAKYSCVQCVGGKIIQTRPASGRTHKDLRGVLYIFMLYINLCISLLTLHNPCIVQVNVDCHASANPRFAQCNTWIAFMPKQYRPQN